MALALSGAILQGITRNDLADPGIIGINSGAGVAIAVFFLFFPIDVGSFVYMLPLVGFVGALLTASYISCHIAKIGFATDESYRSWFINGTFRSYDCPYFFC